MLDIRKYLSHRCEIVQYNTVPVTPDAWNQSSHYGGTPLVADCICYFGEEEEVLDTMVGIPRMVHSAPTKWQLVLPKQYVQSINVNDKVQNIIEKRTGDSVRQDGIIQQFKMYRHHRHGAMFVLCVLNDGDVA